MLFSENVASFLSLVFRANSTKELGKINRCNKRWSLCHFLRAFDGP